jgi:hypothetical protein
MNRPHDSQSPRERPLAPRRPTPRLSGSRTVSGQTSRTGRREGLPARAPVGPTRKGSGATNLRRPDRSTNTRSRQTSDGLIHDSDFPASDDKLSFSKSALKFAEMLERIDSPMVIFLDGEPGSGRTSYMRMIAHQLEQSNVVVPLWVDGPSFSENGFILSAVIDKLARFGQSPELDELSLRFMTAYSYNRELQGFLPDLRGSPDDLEHLRRNIEFNVAPEPNGMDLFASVEGTQETFLHFIQSVTGPTGRRYFLAFVDDLDACQPATIDRFLSDLFTYTSIPGSKLVWLISLNKNAFEARRSAGNEGRIFLEKIANLILQVPTTSTVRGLVTQYITNLGLPELKNMNNLINEIFEKIEVTNPRIVKRTVSRIGYARTFGSYPRNAQEGTLFCTLTLLYEMFPDFFARIVKDPGAGLLVFAAAGNSYGQSKFNATSLEPMLKPLRAKFTKELEDELFYNIVGYAGQLVGRVYGIRTGNVNEAIPRFKPILNGITQVF